MRRGQVVLAVAVAVAASGCIGTTSRGHFEQIIRERGGGYTSELADEAVDAVAERLGVEDFRIRSMGFYPSDERVLVEVRDPQVPGNLDNYTVERGSVSEVTPVRLSSSDDLAQQTITVSSLAFDRMEEMVDSALGEFDPRNGYVTFMSVAVQGGGKAVFNLSLESDRANGTAQFSAAGELIGVTPL